MVIPESSFPGRLSVVRLVEEDVRAAAAELGALHVEGPTIYTCTGCTGKNVFFLKSFQNPLAHTELFFWSLKNSLSIGVMSSETCSICRLLVEGFV